MKLLKKLYEIHSKSGHEEKMRLFITRYASKIRGAEVIEDECGNIYITKGISETYPCVVAHLDQVHDIHSEDFRVIMDDEVIMGYSPMNRGFEGIGADDKNGIWIGLKCLEIFDVMKCVFFVGEEIGCIGSSKCDMDFFYDVRFVVEPDRKGKGDLINNISWMQIASEEFLNDIDYELYGYKLTNGLMTDVLELSERSVGVSCINLSCGYYNPHTDEEFTSVRDLNNALEFVKHIITKCTKVYKHKAEGGWKRYDYGRYYTFYGLSEPIIPSSSGYMNIDTYIKRLIEENDYEFWPEELWQYVESDLSDYITEQEFIDRAYKYFYEPYAQDEELMYDDTFENSLFNELK